MTHQHAMPERAPCQFLRRLKTTPVQQMAVIIHHICITVNNAGKRLSVANAVCNMLSRSFQRESIACIQKNNIIARSL